MADSQRIDDLRRRVQKDPASIAFAQLAEECRRAAALDEALEVCRAGLAVHPGYLSARVTLGRTLLELNQLDEAMEELGTVLRSAPENLAAIRGTAEIHQRRGDLVEALTQYRAALTLARNDPDLQHTVAELARQVEPPPPLAAEEGLSFEQFLASFPEEETAPAASPSVVSGSGADAAAPEQPGESLDVEEQASVSEILVHEIERAAELQAAAMPIPGDPVFAEPLDYGAPPPDWLASFSAAAPAPASPFDALGGPDVIVNPSLDDSGARDHAVRTIAALERWLDAVHVARAHRSA